MSSRCEVFLEILLAIMLPPLGVFLRNGCCSCEFFICVLLTLLGYIPGIIYAVYAIVVRGAQPDDEYWQPINP
ncbi:hypothetical protein ACJIZ3_025257 [Penstemon smallii]|uniref:Uncharacterized protein n=1 Tax=Penstemon smallii TaxID=265156 RepID=A0ABD3TU61_9LAMI